jgi:hypothetical protein
MAGLLLALYVLALQAPDDAALRFDEARNLFLYQECARAVPLLEGLLYPATQLAPEQELLAREYLGACHFWASKLQAADLEFTALLLKKPSAALDPFYYPAEMIRHFDELKRRIVAQGLVPGPDRPPVPKPPVVERVREVHVTHRSRLPLFLPFGVPQINNDRPVSGVLFAAGQGLTLATNVGCYLAIELMRGADGRMSDADYPRGRALQGVLYGAVGTFAALWAWSIVDGWLGFPGDTTEELPGGPLPGPATPPAALGLGVSAAGTPLVTATIPLPAGGF